MPRKLILHIGAHKTGSTAIQSYLYENLSNLQSLNWDLFCWDLQGERIKTGNANHWLEYSGEKQNFRAKVNRNLKSFLGGKTTHNLIFSSEELFWLNCEEDITALRDLFTQLFDKITVVCYLRRQDKHLLSHYQQGFKYPHSTARRFFGDQICHTPKIEPYFSEYLNYFNKIKKWQKIFTPAEFILREFERSKLHQQDSVSDFIQVAQLPLEGPSSGIRITNESVNRVQTIVNHTIFKLDYNLWYELGQQSFTQRAEFQYDLKPALTEAQTASILSYYYESNEELREYIPDLSPAWFTPSNLQDENKVTLEREFNSSDYQAAIYGLAKYYNDMSLKTFFKLKFRKLIRRT